MKNIIQNLFYFLSKIRSISIPSFGKYSFLSLNGFIFFLFVTYKFYNGLKFDIGLLSLILSFIISYLLSSFVLNKFEFSNNIIIRYLQKFVFINICIFAFFIVIGYFSSYLFPTVYCSSDDSMGSDLKKTTEISNSDTSKGKDVVVVTESTSSNNKEYYEFKLRKDVVHKSVNTVSEASKTAVESVIPNIGAGAAAGTTAAAIIKATNGLPLGTRLLALGTSTLTVAAATSMGIGLGQQVLKESFKKDSESNSESNNVTSNDNSSSGSDSFSINSLNEISEMNSPLQILLLYSLKLDLVMLIVFITILYLFLNKYYGPFFLNFIKKTISRYCSNNTKERLEKIFNKGFLFTDRFFFILLVINILNLFFILFLKIYLHSELYSNIDNYVSSYNQIKKGLFLLFLTQENLYSKLPNYLQRLIILILISLIILLLLLYL